MGGDGGPGRAGGGPGGSPETAAVGDQTWARFVLDLQGAMSRTRFRKASEVTGPLRIVKDAAEVEALRAAARAVDEIAAAMRDRPFAGRTEAQTAEELRGAIADLRGVGVDVLTLGQYLRPSARHLPVVKWWTPEEFAELGAYAESLGFAHVESGPLVRSSYHARTAVEAVTSSAQATAASS